jgi:ATP-GRASP peptide maturase of grasp-with-spasm system
MTAYNREAQTLIQFLYYKLNGKRHINSYYNSDVNKLIVLEKAIKVGLLIPYTKILTNKNQASKFIKEIDYELITKTATPASTITGKELIIFSYTEAVNPQQLPIDFFPSMFQKMVEKEFELRIFFLESTFYTMAIFSQNDNQTKIDFRKYNREKPNRTVPFILPADIEHKLLNLMQSLHLNSGSIDMIYGKDEQYYFLEVNPIGQFGMTSFPCNYNLEKKIVEYLMCS